MKGELRHCLHFVLLILVTGSLTAQVTTTSVGDDFWLGFMPNETPEVELSLFISSEQVATGVVEIPLMGWSEAFIANPGQVTTVTLPASAVGMSSGVVDNKGVHVTSDEDVSVYAINYKGLTADGTRIFPTDFLDIEYTVLAYPGLSFLPSQFIIVSTEDGTEIEVTPSCDMEGGITAGVTYTVQLDQGETYQLRAEFATGGDVSGTTIRATETSGGCRPFAVFGGAACANVPDGCVFCDHLFDQCIPNSIWGTDYYVVPPLGPDTYTYRVMSAEDNTDVFVDGVFAYTLDSNEFEEVNSVTEALHISANSPVLVTQYMEGITCSNYGDPAAMALNSAGQTMDNVTFATVVSDVITDHNLSIVVASTAINEVLLDGVLLPSTDFTPFPADPAFSYSRPSITEGSHNLQCPQGVVAYVYGTGIDESYAYSVGTNAFEPADPVDNVICTNGQVTLQGDPTYLDVWWSTQSAPEDTLAIGQPFVIDPPIQNEIYILHGSNLLSGCEQEEVFSVESPEPIVVDIPETTIDLCLDQEYAFSPTISPESNEYVYQWTAESAFMDATVANAVISPSVSGYYYLDVSSFSGCASGRDSVYVNIVNGAVTSLLAISDPLAVCQGDTVFLNALTGINLGTDFFDGGASLSLWSSLDGSNISQVCGSINGDALYFDGAADRSAETIDFDFSNGGTVEFAIQISDGSGPCDGAEIGENVLLQYSIDGGINWTTFTTLFENFYPTYDFVQVEIPAGAHTPSTRLRWIQPTFSAADEDLWMLDNVIIEGYGDPGSPYLWSSTESMDDATAQATFSVPIASAYYSVQNANGGCSFTDSVFVEVGDDFDLTVTNDTVLCIDAPLQLEAAVSVPGNYTYLWDNPESLNSPNISSPIADPLVETLYQVTVTSSAGCVRSDSVLVSIGSSNTTSITASELSICSGPVALEAVVGGTQNNYQFDWSPADIIDDPTASSVIADPTVTTVFEVTIIDTVQGCQLPDAQIEILVNPADLDLPNDTVLCESEGFAIEYDFSPTLFQTFTWSEPSVLSDGSAAFPTITVPLFSDTLILIIDDSEFNCQFTDTMVVTTDELEYLSADSLSLCADSTLQIDIVGDYTTIEWSASDFLDDTDPSAPIFSPPTDDTFYFTVSNPGGCMISDSVHLLINIPSDFELAVDTTLCDGGSLLIDNPLEGQTYLWNTAETTEDITVTAGGIYTVTVTDSSGCSVIDEIEITSHPLPVFNLIGEQQACQGDTITLTADIDDVSYLWDNNGVMQSTDYSLVGSHIAWAEVMTERGCIYRDSLNLLFRPPPTLALSVSGAICEDSPATVTAESDAGQFLWTTGEDSAEIEVVVEQYYATTVTDSVGCTMTDSIFVERITFPLLAVSDTFYCELGSVEIVSQPQPGYSISWSDGTVSDTLNVFMAGEYELLLTDQNCVKPYPFVVREERLPSLELSRQGRFCEDRIPQGGYPIRASSDGEVEWTSGRSEGNVNYIIEEGTYAAIATSTVGCVTEKEIMVPNHCIPLVFAPNAFSPDGDGLNDQWRVTVSGIIDEYSLVIFDREGHIIFETDDHEAAWIGGAEGSQHYVPDGVYHYTLTYGAWTELDEIVKERIDGTITVVR